MLENINFALQSVTLHLQNILISFFLHQIVIGFGIGFCAATGIYSLLLAEEPRHLPIMLTRSANVCFEKIAVKNEDGTYASSYADFLEVYNRVKTLFYSIVLVFLLLIGMGLLF